MTLFFWCWNWQSPSRSLVIGGAITLTGCNAFVFEGNYALAQITPDRTLGAESSVVTPNVNIKGIPADRIDGGATRGTNLFHSFSEFNILDGQRVYFASPVRIENILTRVTGGNLSNILGTLGVNGTANLFLLNPNGIIFGPNARLDIAGSFLASTANSVIFNNGFEFSATKPEAPPLLMINLRPGLQYGTNQSGAIANAGNLTAGQDLTLAASNLDLQNQLQAGRNLTLQALDTVKVRDSVVNPFIASAGGQLLVQGNQGVDIFALNHPSSGFFSNGDMVLRSANTVGGDAHYWSGASFRIEQLDGTLGNLSSPYDPIIRSLGDVSFNSYVGASLHILAAGQVNIGQVRITGSETGTDGINYIAEDVRLSDRRTVVPVNGRLRPTLDVRAGVNPAEVGNPGLTGNNVLFDIFNNIPFFGSPTITNTATSADINIGSITVEQPNGLVLLTNQYKPNPALNGNIQVRTIRVNDNVGSLFGSFNGDGGDVFFDSRGNIIIPGSGQIKTDSATGVAGDISLIARGSISLLDKVEITSNTRGAGRSGNINIQAASLVMTGGAQLNASTYGRGNAGNVNINVRDAVSLTDSRIFSNVASGADANAGNINIQAGSLSLTTSNTSTDVAQLQTLVSSALDGLPAGRGNAGNITIDVRDNAVISGRNIQRKPSGLFTDLMSEAVGNAGNIKLKAGELLMDSGMLSTITQGQGNAGDIEIETGSLQMKNLALLWTSSSGQGNAGNVSIKNTDYINLSNKSFIITSSIGTGNAGNLDIETRSLSLQNESQINSGAGGSGTAGNLTVRATDSVNLANRSVLSANGLDSANGGNLIVETRQLNIQNGSGISTITTGSGQGGNLRVQASDSVNLDNQGTITTSSLGTGAAGNLDIETGRLNLQDASVIGTAAFNSGDAGNLTVKATESVNVVNNSKLSTDTSSSGNAGNLTIDTGSLSIQDSSKVSALTTGSGQGGNLTVKAADSVNIANNSNLSADTSSSGNSGNLTIDTGNLRIQDSSKVSALTTGSGQGGNLRVQASDSVSVDNQSWITTFSTDTGVAGNLSIATGRLSVRDGSLLTTSTLGSGNAGDLTVQAANSVEVANNSILSSSTLGSGSAGDLTIGTRELSLLNTGIVSTSTTSSGRGGNLTVQASDSINLVNLGGLITSSTDTGAAGNLSVETGKLSIRDTSGISTTTFGAGDAGDLKVKATDSVEVVNGSRLLTDTRGSGNAGNLTVETGKFTIQNGSEVAASTAPQSSGRGGTVSVKASDSVDISGSSGLFTFTVGTGRAGDMTVQTTRLSAKDGGRVEAGTFGIAPGGNLTVNASESIDLSGSSNGGVFRSGLSAFSLTAGNARSGNLTIATKQLIIQNGAEVTVTSLKGQAGNIDVTANSLLMNQGRITAETRLGTGEGGANVSLQLAEDLLMNNESRISATAFDAANGGNVTINTRFIIAFPPKGPEGSDIIANAFLGNGGRVNVTTQSLFGIDFRKRLTPFNDITASSEFGNQGVVTINILGVDPARGLGNLPAEPGVPEPLEGCQPRGRRGTGSFVNTGRGGLSPNPTEPLGSNEVWRDVQLPTQLTENSANAEMPSISPTRNPGTIVEAQGWIINEKGNVELVAEMPSIKAQWDCRLR